MILKAKVNALKHRYDAYEGDENYSEENNFDEVERQYEEFRKFFKSVWRTTKRAIKKDSRQKMKQELLDAKSGKVKSADEDFSSDFVDKKIKDGEEQDVSIQNKKAE